MVKVKIIGADSLILKGKAGQKFKTKVIGAYSLKFAPKRFIPTGIYPLDFQLIPPTPIFISPSDMSELYTVAEGDQTYPEQNYLNLFNFPVDIALYTTHSLIRPQPTDNPTTFASFFPPLHIRDATRNREFAKWGKVKFQVGSETREFEITDIPFSVYGADREDLATGQIGIIEIYPYGFGNEKVVFKYKVDFQVYWNTPWIHETLTIAPAGSSNQRWFNQIEAYYSSVSLGSGYPLNILPNSLFDFGTHTVDYGRTQNVQKFLRVKVRNTHLEGNYGTLYRDINFTWSFHTYVKHWASLKMSGDLGNYFWQATRTDASYPVWWESVSANIKFDENLGIPTKAPVGYGTLIIDPNGDPNKAEIVLERTSTNKITVYSGVLAKKYFFTVYNSPQIFYETLHPSYPFAFYGDRGLFSHTYIGNIQQNYVLEVDFEPSPSDRVFIQYSEPSSSAFSTDNIIVPSFYRHNNSIIPSWFARKGQNPDGYGWWIANNTIYETYEPPSSSSTFIFYVGGNQDKQCFLRWFDRTNILYFEYLRDGAPDLIFSYETFDDLFPLPLWIDIPATEYVLNAYWSYRMSMGLLLLQGTSNSLLIKKYVKVRQYWYDHPDKGRDDYWAVREYDFSSDNNVLLGIIYLHDNNYPKWVILGHTISGTKKIYTIQENLSFFSDRTLTNFFRLMEDNGVYQTDMRAGADPSDPTTIYYYHNLNSSSILNFSTFSGVGNTFYLFFKTSPKLKGIGLIRGFDTKIYNYICGTNPANNYNIVEGGTQISSSATWHIESSRGNHSFPITSTTFTPSNLLPTDYWENLNFVSNYSKGF